MTIEHKVRDKKMQYDINREAAKLSALSSGKIYKNEYLTGKEILPSKQSQMIKQAKLSCSLLGKTLEKHTKKQADALKSNQVDKLKQIKRN